jgi:hypothetical protein
MNWLERARREIPNTPYRGTAKTAETDVSSVMAVAHQGISENLIQTDDGIIWAEIEAPAAVCSREERRESVLAMLTNDPNLQRAYLVEPDAYPSAASVFIADRDKSFEVLIPRRWFDPFAVAELVRTWVR